MQRGARIVLVDDDGVRATVTAHWMKEMGWDVATMTVDMRVVGTAAGRYVPRVRGLDGASVPEIDTAGLHARLAAGGVKIVDLDWSPDYVAGHIPGAFYAIRSRLVDVSGSLPDAAASVFASCDGTRAKLAAAEWSLGALVPVLALSGGTAAWRVAGHPIERGATRMACPPDDLRLRARAIGKCRGCDACPSFLGNRAGEPDGGGRRPAVSGDGGIAGMAGRIAGISRASCLHRVSH